MEETLATGPLAALAWFALDTLMNASARERKQHVCGDRFFASMCERAGGRAALRGIWPPFPAKMQACTNGWPAGRLRWPAQPSRPMEAAAKQIARDRAHLCWPSQCSLAAPAPAPSAGLSWRHSISDRPLNRLAEGQPMRGSRRQEHSWSNQPMLFAWLGLACLGSTRRGPARARLPCRAWKRGEMTFAALACAR